MPIYFGCLWYAERRLTIILGKNVLIWNHLKSITDSGTPSLKISSNKSSPQTAYKKFRESNWLNSCLLYFNRFLYIMLHFFFCCTFFFPSTIKEPLSVTVIVSHLQERCSLRQTQKHTSQKFMRITSVKLSSYLAYCFCFSTRHIL